MVLCNDDDDVGGKMGRYGWQMNNEMVCGQNEK